MKKLRRNASSGHRTRSGSRSSCWARLIVVTAFRKEHMQVQSTWTSTLLIVAALVGSCGPPPAVVYVSYPHVNTRERVVEERLRDMTWLETQLRLADSITTSFQGLREFREATELYAGITGRTDAAERRLERLDLERQELEKRTEIWNLKKAALEAERAYAEAQKKKPEGDGTGSAEDSTDNDGNEEPKPDVEGEPPGDTAATKPAIPYPSPPAQATGAPEATRATAGLLDLFHDRMAYRDAVQAAMRQVQLDDSHDKFGSIMYELTFSVSALLEGDDHDFLEVHVHLDADRDEIERERDLIPLYGDWRRWLRQQIAVEMQRIQRVRPAAKEDEQFVRLFADGYLAGVAADLRARNRRLAERLTYFGSATSRAETAVLLQIVRAYLTAVHIDGAFGLLDEDLLRAYVAHGNEPNAAATDSLRTLFSRTIQRNLTALAAEARRLDGLDGLLAATAGGSWLSTGPDRKEVSDAAEAIAWAVWWKYQKPLEGILVITQPGEDRPLEVMDVPSIIERKEWDEDRFKWAIPLSPSVGIADAGMARWVRRVIRTERRVYAMSVEPNEYAQNISEVSARRQLLSLAASLKAIEAGTDVDAEVKYARQSEELLNAITRMPLAIGFGSGESDFGWVLGPRFQIQEGHASFSHTPIRHDVSVAIVVPAWWTRVPLGGRYSWFDSGGDVRDGGTLWPSGQEPSQVGMSSTQDGDGRGENYGEDVLWLRLPWPDDAMLRLTEAVVGTSIGIDEPNALIAKRPRPRIEQVTPDSLRAGMTGQALLITGSDLWRSPQVMVGSQRASKVEILSDMEGLLATFDNLQFPSEDTKARFVDVDLTVVTSVGPAAHLQGRVHVLRPLRPNATAKETPQKKPTSGQASKSEKVDKPDAKTTKKATP